jgi:hypothetical protein
LRGWRVRVRRVLGSGGGEGDFECESRRGLPLGAIIAGGTMRGSQTSGLLGLKEPAVF